MPSRESLMKTRRERTSSKSWWWRGPHRYGLRGGVSVAAEQEADALGGPGLPQYMLDTYPEDKLRGRMRKAMDVTKDFDVARKTPPSSVTEDELRGAPDTTSVNC